MNKPTPYTVRTGLDGKLYAVFANSADLEDFDRGFPSFFDGCRPACFGGYDNAYCIDDWVPPRLASVNG